VWRERDQKNKHGSIYGTVVEHNNWIERGCERKIEKRREKEREREKDC
jgi:hypothetical protein